VRYTFLSLAIGLLFCCSPNDRPENGSSSFTNDIKQFDTIVSFSGSWLSEDYYNSIRQFKSPKKAQDNSEFIVIPERTLQPTIMIYNFHEGGPFLKILKNKGKYEMWEVQDDSLIQRFNEVEIISSSKIILGDKTFEKISPLTQQGNHKVLEEILFKGHYTSSDGKHIEFKNDGQLTGLDNFNFYEPVIDYFDQGMDVDQIRLRNTQSKLDYYGFKFIGDTLELYKLNCLEFDSTSKNCGIVEYGQLIHKLWKY
jgi:hypothetical protein